MHDGVGRHDPEVELDVCDVRGAEQQGGSQRGRSPQRVARDDIEPEEPDRDGHRPDETRDQAAGEQGMALEGCQPERTLVPRGPVQIGHENESREHVGGHDVRPRNQRDPGGTAQRQPRIEDQLLRAESEEDAEEQPRGRPETRDRSRRRDAETGEDREVHHRVRRDHAKRRPRGCVTCERARQHGRRVERPAGHRIDHQEPQRDNQAR